jgi:hypothetical protein
MTTSEIQYKYALSGDGSFIDINSVTPSERKDYVCLSCGGIVRPILGEVNRKHFRHKVSSECSNETYLHKMGKLLFQKNYEECLESDTGYRLAYESLVSCDYCKHGPCGITTELRTFDLTVAFKSVFVETRDDSLIPDLMLTTESGNKIYIEIAVTHKCSAEKINSGTKIIEFLIQTEDDLKIWFIRLTSTPDSANDRGGV